MQSEKLSAVEAGANVSVGFVLGVACNYLLLPVVGTGFYSAMLLTLAFTALSYVRQYLFRRLFNRIDNLRELVKVLTTWRRTK